MYLPGFVCVMPRPGDALGLEEPLQLSFGPVDVQSFEHVTENNNSI